MPAPFAPPPASMQATSDPSDGTPVTRGVTNSAPTTKFRGAWRTARRTRGAARIDPFGVGGHELAHMLTVVGRQRGGEGGQPSSSVASWASWPGALPVLADPVELDHPSVERLLRRRVHGRRVGGGSLVAPEAVDEPVEVACRSRSPTCRPSGWWPPSSSRRSRAAASSSSRATTAPRRPRVSAVRTLRQAWTSELPGLSAVVGVPHLVEQRRAERQRPLGERRLTDQDRGARQRVTSRRDDLRRQVPSGRGQPERHVDLAFDVALVARRPRGLVEREVRAPDEQAAIPHHLVVPRRIARRSVVLGERIVRCGVRRFSDLDDGPALGKGRRRRLAAQRRRRRAQHVEALAVADDDGDLRGSLGQLHRVRLVGEPVEAPRRVADRHDLVVEHLRSRGRQGEPLGDQLLGGPPLQDHAGHGPVARGRLQREQLGGGAEWTWSDGIAGPHGGSRRSSYPDALHRRDASHRRRSPVCCDAGGTGGNRG